MLNILKENKPDGFDEDMKRIYNEIKNMEEDGLMHFYTKEERKEEIQRISSQTRSLLTCICCRSPWWSFGFLF